MTTVMKFGGTSVGSPEALKRVAGIIRDCNDKKIVVASAMSGVTNFLVSMVRLSEKEKEMALKEFDKKHRDTAAQLFEGAAMDEFIAEYETRYAKLEALVHDKEAAKDPYYEDNVTSQGERFSTLLLAHVLKGMGIEALALQSEDCGIIAEGKPLNGFANLRMTEMLMEMKVKPFVDSGKVPIITGFYGINKDGNPLTFGRGGSDYSAAVVANGINADLLEIWTDVDGFMSADPRVIKNTVRIDEMSYGEAAELAYFGAKVLHPRTIEPVRIKHIPLKVRNSFKPQDPGTRIHNLRATSKTLLKSVATKTDLSIISIASAEIAYNPAMVARIVEKLSLEDIAIYSVSTSLSTIAMLIHNNDVKAAIKRLHELDSEDIERIDVSSDVALVCCVGDDLISKVGVSGDIFGAVKEAGASVEMISEGASDVSLNFVVPMASVTDVIAALHKNFVEVK